MYNSRMIIFDDQAHQQMTLYFQCIEVAIGLEESFCDCSKLSFYYQLQHDYIITFMLIQIYNRTSYSNCYSLLQSLHPQCSVERQLANIANNLMSIKYMIMQQ